MNKHTPGPWFCGRALRGGQECIIGDGDSVVAFMPDRTIGCSFIREDAILIAAAPKLLEALIALEAYVRDTAHHNAPQAAHARSVIAKATGEQLSR